ncbi:MAG: ATP-binding protein [Bacilli bacterium]|nr:ATP-binding protein [Bacilli bacterium]
MKVAVLSGKGGTGKTLVAVNLAAAAFDAVYVDCDVEEPNGHLFFKPQELSEEKVSVKIPYVLSNLCDGSRHCVEFCRFHALAYVNNKLMVFEDICHSCGGCSLVCPNHAIKEKYKVIGRIVEGRFENVEVLSGFLNPGEVSGMPIIKGLLQATKQIDKTIIIDCPPGSACPVMESIRDADYCLLVAEPTIFGTHNLGMVHELVTVFNKPFAVILNKCGDGENPAKTYCLEHNIAIIAEIPYDQQIADISSNGYILVRENSKYQKLFSDLLSNVQARLKP